MAYQAWDNIEVGKRLPTIIFQLLASISYPKKRKIRVRSSRLKQVKLSMLKHIQPEINQSKRCVLMMLSNLAFPQWATVNCAERLLIDLVCMLKEGNEKPSLFSTSILNCNQNDILHKHECFGFLYFDNSKTTMVQSVQDFTPTTTALHKKLEFLFLAIHVSFPPILLRIKDDVSSIEEMSYEKIHEVLRFKFSKKSVQSATGFFVRQLPAVNQTRQPHHIFTCQNGIFISSLFVCDGIAHCGNGDISDENNCTCSFVDVTPQCKFLSENSKWICSPLYYIGRFSKCKTFTAQTFNSENKISVFNEKNNCSRLHISLQNDLVVDCGQLIDEKDLTHLLMYETTFSCSTPDKIPCRKGHSRCFNVSEICVFRLDAFNNLIPCRTGEHMEMCQNFHCNNKFKCPGFYCLPWAYVCDGKWDCPFGHDESITQRCGQKRKCQHMFKCINSQICIHVEDICDNFNDCPLYEDEQMCDLKYAICPKECHCQNYAMFCYEASLNFLGIFLSPFLSLIM